MKNTKLCFIKSKKPETIIEYVRMLPYKIEIKGNAIYAQNKWHLFFNLPDHMVDDMIPTGDLDK